MAARRFSLGCRGRENGHCYNAYALLDKGRIEAIRFKVDLPNYGVFDEKRVFTPGPMPGPVVFKGVRIGIPICEDIWGPDPVECIAETGGEILLVPNGSPYWRGKTNERLSVAVARVVESKLPLIYLESVRRPGRTCLRWRFLRPQCRFLARFPASGIHGSGRQDGLGARTQMALSVSRDPVPPIEEGDEADYAACVLGLRDYVNKNGFPGVVMGLSGGIDSALCAAISVDALGPGRVHCLMLPYRFTSNESLSDAEQCARALGVRYDILPIAPAIEGFERVLAPIFKGTNAGITEENIQSRARGTRADVGFEQIRSDARDDRQQVGNVGRLCDDLWRHERRVQSDQGSLQDGGVPPRGTAQSLEAQRRAWTRRRGDRAKHSRSSRHPPNCAKTRRIKNSLPPYEVLDAILEGLVEKEMRVSDVVALGHDLETVKKIERLLYLAEYKRRQSAPGVKVTKKNFGRDRRYPIVNLVSRFQH